MRHGLNVSEPASQSQGAEIEGVAGRFMEGENVTTMTAQLAAEAQAHLVRVRNIKRQTLQLAAQRIQVATGAHSPLSPEDILAQALAECADQLLKLDGYERKALSRRKKALRALWE